MDVENVAGEIENLGQSNKRRLSEQRIRLRPA